MLAVAVVVVIDTVAVVVRVGIWPAQRRFSLVPPTPSPWVAAALQVILKGAVVREGRAAAAPSVALGCQSLRWAAAVVAHTMATPAVAPLALVVVVVAKVLGAWRARLDKVSPAAREQTLLVAAVVVRVVRVVRPR